MTALCRPGTLLACLFVCACSQPKPVSRPISASPQASDYRRVLTEVEIVGNQALSDKQIETGLINHGPRGLLRRKTTRLNPGELANDAERILGAYRQYGYFEAAVDNIEIERQGPRQALLRFVVEEGQPVTVDDVKLDWKRAPTGAGADTTHELRDKITDDTLLFECCRRHTRRGDTLNYGNYINAKGNLRAFFHRQGYAYASIDGEVEVNRRLRLADVHFELDPGPLVKFRNFVIYGMHRIPHSVVKNRIAWKPGEVYDPDLIATTRGRLLRLRGISSVDIDLLSETRAEHADIAIHVYENAQRELRLGGGAAVDAIHWEARVRAEYSKNSMKVDRRLNLRAQLQPAIRWMRSDPDQSTLGGEARVELERIDLFAPLLTALGTGTYSLERYESYAVLGPAARLGLKRPFFGEWLEIGAAWNMQRFNFQSVNPAIEANPEFARDVGIEGAYRLGWFEQTVAVDRRDNAVTPHNGFYLRLGLEEAGEFAGSRFDEVSLDGDLRGYYAPFDRLVLGARVAHARLLSRGTTLPITRRYFAGGATSQRGFSQRRLSPTLSTPKADGMGTDIAYIGGDARVETSVEARLNLFRVMDNWFGVVAFLDGADVALRDSDIDYGNLHWATGLGVRLATPVGPVRLDGGFRLNRYGMGEPDPNNRFAVHLSIGEAF